MVCKFLVLDEYASRFARKDNSIPHMLACVDMSDEVRLTHTLQVELPAGQSEHKGKLRGKTIEVALRKFRTFGQDVIAEGDIRIANETRK